LLTGLSSENTAHAALLPAHISSARAALAGGLSARPGKALCAGRSSYGKFHLAETLLPFGD